MLASGGKDGMFMLMMSLSWWAASAVNTADIANFRAACADVRWVLLSATATISNVVEPEDPLSSHGKRRPPPASSSSVAKKARKSFG